MIPPVNSRPAHLLGQRAVVMGASLAGLLAARVLSERFAEVVLLERDALPAGPAPRKGTPHALQPHGLLARGREVIEELFPGFTRTLMDRGARCGDLQRDTAFDADATRFATGECGHLGLAVSRLAIEAELRTRVLALPGVRAVTEVDVLGPVFDGERQRVTGVRYAARNGAAPVADTTAEAAAGQPTSRAGNEAANHAANEAANEPANPTAIRTIEADLTIDCTGRGSRTPAWLAAWGFEAPAEERVTIGLCYTSAYFRREGAWALGAAIGPTALICAATPALPRPAVMLAQEPAADGVPRWVVGVGGYAGDHPVADIDGMRRRALQIGSPELVKLTHEAERIGEVMRYHFPHSQRRRFEKMARFPAGYLVMGDALTSFNPIYGQGMTVAACEAIVLRHGLVQGTAGLQQRFFRAAAKVIDIPWQLAVGSDLALDAVPGPRPLPVRLINAWVARLYRVAPNDPAVARAFLKVVHLLAAPASLFAPGIVARVLWKGRRGAAAPQALTQPLSEARTAAVAGAGQVANTTPSSASANATA